MTAALVTQAPLEVLYSAAPTARVSQAVVEVLYSTAPLPSLAEIVPPNGLQTTLAADLGAGAQAMQIQGIDAARFPPAGSRYRCVLFNDAVNGPWELVAVTSGQGTPFLGVTRAVEPYNAVQTAYAWPAGTRVVPVITQSGMQAMLGPGQKLLLNYRETADLASGAAVTANVWTNIGTAKTFSVDDATALVTVSVGGYAVIQIPGAGGGDVGTAVLIDGTTRYLIGGIHAPSSDWGHLFGGVAPLPLTGLSVGQHTVQVQFFSPAAGTWWLVPASSPNAYSFTVRVVETPGLTGRSGGGGGAKLLLDYAQATDINGTTAVDVWTDVGTDKTFTVDDPNALVAFEVSGGITGLFAGGSVRFAARLMIDGVTAKTISGGAGSGASPTTFFNYLDGAGPVEMVGLTAGTHTVRLQIRDNGGSTWTCQPVTRVYDSLQIRVVQHSTPQSAIATPSVPGTKLVLDWAAITDLANNVAVTTGSWVDVPGTTQTFTVDDPNALVEIAVNGYVGLGGAATSTQFGSRVLVDATTSRFLGSGWAQNGTFTNALAGAARTTVDGLAVGQHTLKIQVNLRGANANMYCQPVTNPGSDYLGIRVWQVPKQTTAYGIAAKKIVDWTAPSGSDLFSVALTANTWTDLYVLPSFTVDDPTALIQLILTGNVQFAAGSASVYDGALRLVVDGVSNYTLSGVVGNQYLSPLAGAGPVTIGPLAAGVHTLKLQGFSDLAATARVRNNTTQFEFLSLRVLQISQGGASPAPPVGYEVVLTAPQSSVTLPVSGQLPQGYRGIRLRVKARCDLASSQDTVLARINGDAALASYTSAWKYYGTSEGTGAVFQATYAGMVLGEIPAANAPAGYAGTLLAEMHDYAGTGFHKQFASQDVNLRNAAAADMVGKVADSAWLNTAAVTTVTLVTAGGANFAAGSVFSLELVPAPSSPPGVPGPGAGPVKGPEVVVTGSVPSVRLPVNGQLLQTYRNLKIEWQCRSDAAVVDQVLLTRLSDDTGATYDYLYAYVYGANALSAGDNVAQTQLQLSDCAGGSAPAGAFAVGVMSIPNYSGANQKSVIVEGMAPRGATTFYRFLSTGTWRSTAPVTSITFWPAAGNFVAGTIFTLTYEP